MGTRVSQDGCGKPPHPTGIRSPDFPARSESLYRLRCSATICLSRNTATKSVFCIETVFTPTWSVMHSVFLFLWCNDDGLVLSVVPLT